MTVLNILKHPDARLRLKAEPVTAFNAETETIIRDMLETMYHTDNSAGLAATQVNILKRIITIDLSADQSNPLYLINPEILDKSEALTHQPEGCLSVMETINAPIPRAKQIKVRSYTLDGKAFEFECDGFLAKCIQHEIDHLNGILFIDYLSS